VTTPQEISLADVRKSINFCRQVNMKVLGVVENMSDYTCPHCGEQLSLFGKGGGAKMASHMKVPILGEIPIDPEMVLISDRGGIEALAEKPDMAIRQAYDRIIDKIVNPTV
jgi:hypothetical protein